MKRAEWNNSVLWCFQICASGVRGAPGQCVSSHAAVEWGSATGGPWPLPRGPAVGASRHRARAATLDCAQVHNDPVYVFKCEKEQEEGEVLHDYYITGERCEDRGRVYQESCANQCPRSCTDLWEHVQCLQGVCHPGKELYLLTPSSHYRILWAQTKEWCETEIPLK